MPPTEHLLAFVITAVLIIGVPGPSVLFVVTRSLTLGRRAGVATVVGNASGVYVQLIGVAFGIGALVERSVVAFNVIKLGGAAYLIFLGVRAVQHRRSLAAALDQPVTAKSLRRIVRDGFVVGLANPKSIVFFAAILPQFVDAHRGHVPQQLLILGVLFFVIALICDSIWALLAGTIRAWLVKTPRRLDAIGGTGGLVMIAIGASLAISGRKD